MKCESSSPHHRPGEIGDKDRPGRLHFRRAARVLFVSGALPGMLLVAAACDGQSADEHASAASAQQADATSAAAPARDPASTPEAASPSDAISTSEAASPKDTPPMPDAVGGKDAASGTPSEARRRVDFASLGYDLGDRKAPVRVLEMSDFGCGYCRKFHLETWPVLRKEFVATGKVQWKFVPFVTGMFPHSDVATMAAECALEQGPDPFEAMRRRLWQDQSTWKKAGDAAHLVRGWAAEAGLDLNRYDACMEEGRPAERIAAGRELARQLGVRGTPTFFILGYPPLPGALPTERFRKVLTLAYEDATGQGK